MGLQRATLSFDTYLAFEQVDLVPDADETGDSHVDERRAQSSQIELLTELYVNIQQMHMAKNLPKPYSTYRD
jgi:hypothetical protein